MAVKALRKIQLGQETTAGTAVDATNIWRGNGVLTDEREIVPVEEDVGLLLPTDRSYIPKYGAVLEMEETPLTFEQAPYIFSASIENIVSGTQDGTQGSGYIYQYDFATNAENVPKTYTLEMGDDQRVDEMEYSYVETFSISGAGGEGMMISATWRGRQATDAEFTTGISLPTVEEALFGKTSVYIDTSGGTIGTTSKTGSIMAFNLEYSSGRQALYTADGNLYFSATKCTGQEVTGSITFEHDTTGEAELSAARSEAVRLIRFNTLGSALTTAGTAYTYKTLKVDMAIQYTEVPPISDQDGNDTIELPFRVVWLAAKSLGGQVIVVNELSALT